MLTITHENVPKQFAFNGNRKTPRATSVFRALSVPICLAGLLVGQMAAQDANESLGPKDRAAKGTSTPLLLEMKTLRSSVRPELSGVHPRVYFTGAELDALRMEAHGGQKTKVVR